MKRILIAFHCIRINRLTGKKQLVARRSSCNQRGMSYSIGENRCANFQGKMEKEIFERESVRLATQETVAISLSF